MKKRLISSLLILAMVLALFPVTAFAANAAVDSVELVYKDGGNQIKIVPSATYTSTDTLYYLILNKDYDAVSASYNTWEQDLGIGQIYGRINANNYSTTNPAYASVTLPTSGTGDLRGKTAKIYVFDATSGQANLANAVTGETEIDAEGYAPRTSFTITWNVDGTETTDSQYEGSKLTLPTAPTKAGYNFKGWFTAATDGTQVTENTTVSAAATYYAQWTEKATLTAANFEVTSTHTYNGNPQNVTVSPKSGITGTGAISYTSGRTETNAGDSYTVTFDVAEGNDYKAATGLTLTWAISKADQAAPTVSKTDVTAADADDGTITITGFAANTFEYQTPGASTWTDVTASPITGLAPGTYKVRLKGDANHNDGAAAEVTITEPGAPVATITDLAKTYTGKPQKATVVVKIDGVEQDAADYEVVYKDKDGNTVADPTNAGNYTVTVTMNGKTAGTETLVIAKAKPGAPELLDEIIVDETTLGDVMKNGELKLPGVNNDEVTGTFTWLGDVDDDTMIVPGTKYQWKFETNNPNYQGLTDEIAWELVNNDHLAYMFGTNAAKTTFEPNRGMTRAEVAVMIANLEEYDKDVDYSADLSIPQDLKAEKANLEKWTDNGYNKICYILSEGIMRGRQDGNFDPYGTITRQEMAIVLGKYLGIAKYDGADLFDDLNKTAVYAEGKAYINALKDAKKIDGFPDGGYHPTENLTRAQAAKMMNYAMDRAPDIAKMKAANVKTGFVDVQKFVGITDADWAVYNIIEASVTHAVSEYH